MTLAEQPMLSRFLRPLRSVGPTLGANLLNQAVVALSQLLVIPLLIGLWGVAGFGTWLLLSAIPTYLAISDLGFTTSAKSDMSMRVVRGDVEGARVTVSSVAALLVLALGVIALVYIPLAAMGDWVAWLNLSGTDNDTARIVLLLGLVQLGAYQAFLLSASVLRAAGRPALEVMLSAAFRLLETLALVAAAWAGLGFVGAAIAWAGMRALTTVVLWILIYLRLPHLAPKLSLIHWPRVRELLAPSLGFMLMPLANAISIQGTVLVLGAITGPAAVAIFTTIRVVTRLGISAAISLNGSFTPQYSYLAGAKKWGEYKRLLTSHAIVLFMGVIAFLIVMAVLGPLVIRHLTHNQQYSLDAILVILSIAVAAEMAWGMIVAIKSATNEIGRFSLAWVFIALASLALAFPIGSIAGQSGVAATVAIAHITMLLYALLILYRDRRK